MELSLLIQQFCEYSAHMRGYSPATITRYRTAVHLFSRHAAVTQLEQCTPDKVREFFFHGRADRHWSAGTFLTYHKSLVVFFRWCVTERFLEVNPAEGMEVPKPPRSLPSKLSQQEAERLLELTRNYPWPYAFQRYRNHAILATFLYAGLRKQELLHLKLVVFFRWCVTERFLEVNPAEGMEVPKPPRSLPSKLSQQEAERLLDRKSVA